MPTLKEVADLVGLRLYGMGLTKGSLLIHPDHNPEGLTELVTPYATYEVLTSKWCPPNNYFFLSYSVVNGSINTLAAHYNSLTHTLA